MSLYRLCNYCPVRLLHPLSDAESERTPEAPTELALAELVKPLGWGTAPSGDATVGKTLGFYCPLCMALNPTVGEQVFASEDGGPAIVVPGPHPDIAARCT